jgi:branched-chain amino acid aminotransferase
VLSLAREAQIPVDEGHFGIEAIHKADECFLTNTSIEVLPVTMVDKQLIGKGGIPGPLTQQLRTHFLANRARFLER